MANSANAANVAAGIADTAGASERDRFEKSITASSAQHGVVVALSTHADGTYRVASIQSAWAGWQARAAIAAPPAPSVADDLANAYTKGYEDGKSFAQKARSLSQSSVADAAKTDHATLIAETLHWPEHWDTAAYPDVWSALQEVMCSFQCSECRIESVADAAGASEDDVRDAARWRHLRNCGVIVDFTHAGPWKFTDDVDAAVDKLMARSAAIKAK